MTADISSRRIGALILSVLALVLTIAGLWWVLARDTSPNLLDRRAEVAERGAAVMPFDLDKTTHSFQPVADGGQQTVTAHNPTDIEQIRLIREHLTSETAKFTAGDFGDPATIHGDRMPGLADLRAGAARITVRYEELPDGARLFYTTNEPPLVSALHQWFEAQSSDHGTGDHGN
ncbi:hypothetical protein AB0G00_30960 [Nocardia salmonicida]|uniref:Aspartate carbamoyltransferase n=1 Tax=Nocardia fluminea TaxID=134984 RepID=A0A2N3VH43_9NOCA|nr:aspartate carbamoyltransferase [Nocardia fluminea]PKV80947.1 hypothetical protein ATK86_5387 [Nocardia fluminea]